MARKFDAQALKQQRLAKGWSQEKLSAKSGVNKQTIHRLEAGQRKVPQDRTVQRLAAAMGIPEEALTGEVAGRRPETEVEDDGFTRRFPVGSRIDQAARNALALVCRRYRVSPAQVLELAPLLFYAMAEGSLRTRQQRLDKLDTLLGDVEDSASSFPHLPRGSFSNASNALEWKALEHERRSIAKLDLFGTIVDEAPIHSGDPNFESGLDNPFAVFLLTQMKELEPKAEFRGMTSLGSPDYRICGEQAAEYVGDDSHALEAVMSGDAALHEMPKELRDSSSDKRAAWAKEQAQHRRDRLNELLGMPLTLGDDL